MIVAEDFVLYGGVTYRPWRWRHVASKPGDPVTCDVVVSQEKRIFGCVARPRMAILEVGLACLERYRVSDLSMKTPADESDTGSCLSALSGAEVICGMIIRRWVDWRVRTPSNWIRGMSYAGSLREVIVVFSVLPPSFSLTDQRRYRHFMVTGSSAKIRTVYLPNTVCSGWCLKRVLPAF
jgi:hypothetical protein